MEMESNAQHFWWGTFTLFFVFMPALMSLLFKTVSLKERFIAFLKHLPGFQFLQHIKLILSIFNHEKKVREWELKAQQQQRLRQAYLQKKSEMEKQDNELLDITERGRQIGVLKARAHEAKINTEDHIRAKAEVEMKMEASKSELQEFRIYEAYGESLPQFVLQLSILLKRSQRENYGDMVDALDQLLLDPWSKATLVSSFLSMVLTVTNMTMTLPVFYKGQKHLLLQDSFMKFFKVLPLTMLVVTPRMVALSVFFSSFGTEGWYIMVVIGILFLAVYSIAFMLKYLSKKNSRDFTDKEEEYIKLGFFTAMLSPITIIDLQWDLYMFTCYLSSCLYSAVCIIHLSLFWWTLDKLELKYMGQAILKKEEVVECAIGIASASECPDLLVAYYAADCILVPLFLFSIVFSGKIVSLINKKNKSKLCLWSYIHEDKETFDEILATPVSYELNATDKRGRNIFLLSCEKGDVEGMCVILNSTKKKKVSFNAVDFEGKDALTIACENQHWHILKILYQCDGKIQGQIKDLKDNLLLEICKAGDQERLEAMCDTLGEYLNWDALDGDGYNPLSLAYKKGHMKIVEYLMQFPKLTVKAKGNVLTQVIRDGRVDTLDLILPDVNYRDNKGNSALMLACQEQQSIMLKTLLQKKDINISGTYDGMKRNILMYACSNGDTEIITSILQVKSPEFDINAQDFDGKTALMLATKEGHIECVELLLREPELDINIRDNLGDTAFIFACMKGHTDIVKMILSSNQEVDFNTKGFEKSGYTWACRNKHEDIINLLKQESERLNIDLHIKDKYGKTGDDYINNVFTPRVIEQDFNPFFYGAKNEALRNEALRKGSLLSPSSVEDKFLQGFL